MDLSTQSTATDLPTQSTTTCDETENHVNTSVDPREESIGKEHVPDKDEVNEDNHVVVENVEIEKIPNSDKIPTSNKFSDHLKCDPENNEDEAEIRRDGNCNSSNFEHEKYNDHGDEHDDFDDSEEEDLHAGENFWCSLCDDGGDLLFCDGPCLRTFHGCISAKKDHDCKTLGFSKEQYQIIVNAQTWICPNCKTNQQLCFLCHQLGKSIGPEQEVFNCHSAHCGRFYHPMCIAKWVCDDKEKQKNFAESVQQNVETFLCPLHTCDVCKKLEDASDVEKKFAKCRRCPMGWHVDCLPKDIPFEKEAEKRGIPQRAWKVELGDEKHHYQVGIYCLKHALPICPCDMVKFPYRPDSQLKWMQGSNALHETSTKELVQPKCLSSKLSTKKNQEIENEKQPIPRTKRLKGSELKKNQNEDAKVQIVHDEQKKIDFKQYSDSKHGFKKKSILKDRIHDPFDAPLVSLSDIKNSVDDIISRSRNHKTIEDIKKYLRTPSFYTDKNGDRDGKFIHEGELLSILTSVPKALNWVKSGKRIDEAKALCPLRSIIQLERVEKALEAFLNPCLYGQRYTSFGRHFTKKEILIEIVDRLQWYIRDKDMIVDFCCGANEFSAEVHRKLVEVEKKNCIFKNFDILAPKNEFNFEQRDWFTLQRHELPSSDKLIMGLNPPFGKRSALANAFIDHAVIFRPKIIILIVPPGTKRLDEHGYELIWEDPRLLGGQAFYLPGSITKEIKNADGTMRFAIGEDWNKNTPPLYLWSRKDWVADHLEIAQKHGHISDVCPKGESQQFNSFYKSKVDWDKIKKLATPKIVKTIYEVKKNKAISQDDVEIRDKSLIKESFQTIIESKKTKLSEEPFKLVSKALSKCIDEDLQLKTEPRRQKLVKKLYTSSQELHPKDNVMIDNGENVEGIGKQNLVKNRSRDGTKGSSRCNKYLEKPHKDDTIEPKKSLRNPIDENDTNYNVILQYDSSKMKKENNVNEEVQNIKEGLKDETGIRSENNVYTQHATTRLKRERSPSMVHDYGDASRFKTKKSNEIINWSRESKRPDSKDEKQTRNDVTDPSKNIIHRQRMVRHDEEISYANRPNMTRENIERNRSFRTHHGRHDVEQERANRAQREKQDVEQERANRAHREKQDFEQERANRAHREKQDFEQVLANRAHREKQDLEQSHANRTHYGKQDFEQDRSNKTQHRRQDIEDWRVDRAHHGRQDNDYERSSRIRQGRQEIEQEPRRKLHHGMSDVDKRERFRKQDSDILNEMNGRNSFKYEDSKRNYGTQELSPKSRKLFYSRNLSPRSTRLSGPQDSEADFRQFRTPQDLSPKSRHTKISSNMLDDKRLEAYDKYSFNSYDHDIRRSPENLREINNSNNQCIDDESKGIAYPKWYTAQANTSNVGRIDDIRSSNLPIDLNGDAFQKDNLKFPILHGNYGNNDFSTRSQAYGMGYNSDLGKDAYMDLHSPRFKLDYSSPQDMTSIQRNNYDNLGVHNSPKKFTSFDTEKSYANQRTGLNSLHAFDHHNDITRDISRDYRMNDFPQNSLIGSNIPSLSRNLHDNSWNHISQNNELLGSYRNELHHTPISKGPDYTTSWNNTIPSSPPSSYRHSTFESPQVSSLTSSWNQPNLYSLPSTNFMPFSQRDLWP